MSSYVFLIYSSIPLHVSMLSHVTMCYSTVHVLPYHFMVYYGVLCYAITCYVMEGLSTEYYCLQWHRILCMLSHAILCHVVCYGMLYSAIGWNGMLLYFLSLYIMVCCHLLLCGMAWCIMLFSYVSSYVISWYFMVSYYTV